MKDKIIFIIKNIEVIIINSPQNLKEIKKEKIKAVRELDTLSEKVYMLEKSFSK